MAPGVSSLRFSAANRFFAHERHALQREGVPGSIFLVRPVGRTSLGIVGNRSQESPSLKWWGTRLISGVSTANKRSPMNPIPTRPLSRRPPHLLGVLSLAGFAAFSMNASAAVAIGVSYVGEVSNSDLVNTGSPDLMFFSSTFFNSIPNINDGTSAAAGISEEDGQFPAITTFHLNVVANPSGYEISQFRIFTFNLVTFGSGPADNFGHHHYMIDYSVVGSADFETLTTVDIAMPESAGEFIVTVNPVPVLTGVDVIRITWLDTLATPNSGSGITEVDIEGTPVTQVPEPSPMLLGAMFLGTVCLRRKRSTTHLHGER